MSEENAGPDEKSAQRHSSCIINSQDGDGCAGDWRVTDKHCSGPLEMFTPVVSPRIEQPDDFASHRVDAGQVGAFVAIAVDAAQGEVFALRRPAVLLRDHMINLKVESRESFRKVAVLTAERSSLPNEFNELSLHLRSRGGALRFERKEGLGFHEFDDAADVKIIFEDLPFFVGHRTAARFRGEFISTAQIGVGKLEGEDGASRFRAPGLIVGGDGPLQNRAFRVG